MLGKIISSFIVISGTKHIFVGIDSTGFKITHASQYYTDRIGYRRKYAKLSIGADVPTRTQNKELSFRCITYNNMHRLTNLTTLMMSSTYPIPNYNLYN